MGVNLTEFYVQLSNPRLGVTGGAIDDDTGRYTVMTINTATRPTIFSDRFGATTITNSIGTLTDGVIQFYIDAATTSVDISVTTALGQSRFIRALTADQHKLDIDQEKREQVLIVPFNGEAADGTDFDQLHSLPIGALVHEAQAVVISATASETLDIGLTTTDPNGFLSLAVLDAVGVVESGPVYTTGIIETFLSTVATRGALLNGGVIGLVGVNIATDVGSDVGRKDFYVATARTISTTQRSSITADGYAVVMYTLLPPHA